MTDTVIITRAENWNCCRELYIDKFQFSELNLWCTFCKFTLK